MESELSLDIGIFTNNGNNGNGQSSGNDTNVTKYTVKGIVWVDKNKDGKRSNDEEKLANITVYAMNATSGSIVSKTSTNEKGEYNIRLEEGKYIIIFRLHLRNGVNKRQMAKHRPCPEL